ncbi:MAG: M48 family metallopeptidase [Dorea sp.]
MNREYTWIRSNRKSIAIQIKGDGSIVIRSPYTATKKQIEAFLAEKEDWIRKHLQRLEECEQRMPEIEEEERQRGIAMAKKIIPERVAFYARIMNVTYGRITIREQKTRWGSCNAAGNLNFNWKLILMPGEVMDYVVVHELAHRKEMNHSKAFWKIVESVLPDYKERRKQLKSF